MRRQTSRLPWTLPLGMWSVNTLSLGRGILLSPLHFPITYPQQKPPNWLSFFFFSFPWCAQRPPQRITSPSPPFLDFLCLSRLRVIKTLPRFSSRPDRVVSTQSKVSSIYLFFPFFSSSLLPFPLNLELCNFFSQASFLLGRETFDSLSSFFFFPLLRGNR